MNCDDLRKHLASGAPITGDAADHASTCAGCHNMLEALDARANGPDAESIKGIEALMAASWKPVQPLPGDGWMVTISLGLFLAFSFLVGAVFGLGGFHHLSLPQRIWYYAFLAGCALALSLATVQEMIPGAKRRVNSGAAVGFSLLLLALLVWFLFPDNDNSNFVGRGIPCLRLGVGCGGFGGALAYLFARTGFFTSPLMGGAVIGSLAGLTGTAVLALHCPIQDSAHIIVWHLASVVICALAGALIGSRSSSSLSPRLATGRSR